MKIHRKHIRVHDCDDAKKNKLHKVPTFCIVAGAFFLVFAVSECQSNAK